MSGENIINRVREAILHAERFGKDRARAAIEAMREPTEEMLRADLDASRALKSPHTLRQQQMACWYAAIDCALSTPQTKGEREP